jgi:hypothetical protein
MQGDAQSSIGVGLMMQMVTFGNAHQRHIQHPYKIHADEADTYPGIAGMGKIGCKYVRHNNPAGEYDVRRRASGLPSPTPTTSTVRNEGILPCPARKSREMSAI